MKLLNELLDPKKVRLNNTQQGTLAIIFNSPTPQTAFNNASGADNVVASRNFLEKLGIVNASSNAVKLTDFGNQVVKSYNIADDSGELTEYGKKLIDDTVEDKNEWKSID